MITATTYIKIINTIVSNQEILAFINIANRNDIDDDSITYFSRVISAAIMFNDIDDLYYDWQLFDYELQQTDLT